jgi:hypothetical protein
MYFLKQTIPCMHLLLAHVCCCTHACAPTYTTTKYYNTFWTHSIAQPVPPYIWDKSNPSRPTKYFNPSKHAPQHNSLLNFSISKNLASFHIAKTFCMDSDVSHPNFMWTHTWTVWNNGWQDVVGLWNWGRKCSCYFVNLSRNAVAAYS